MEDAKKEVVGGNGVGAAAAAVVDVEAEKEKETDALVNSTKVQTVVIFTEKKNALKSLLMFAKNVALVLELVGHLQRQINCQKLSVEDIFSSQTYASTFHPDTQKTLNDKADEISGYFYSGLMISHCLQIPVAA